MTSLRPMSTAPTNGEVIRITIQDMLDRSPREITAPWSWLTQESTINNGVAVFGWRPVKGDEG